MESVLIFGGVAVSLLVELIKRKFGTSDTVTMSAVILLSLGGGAAFYFLKMFGLWEAVLQVLLSAGAFYAFIIRNLKTN